MENTATDIDLRLEQFFFLIENKRHHGSVLASQKDYIRKASKRFVKIDKNWFFIGTKDDQRRLVIINLSERRHILQECHDNPATGGHRGVRVTQMKINAAYYWPGITEDVYNWIKQCDRCQRVGHLKTVGPELHPIVTNGCWDVLGLDLIGPLPLTALGNKYALTMTDPFSKFVYVEAIQSKAAGCVAMAVLNMALTIRIPKRIITDQGKEFNNELNSCVFNALGIEHSVTSAYHPQANGQDERTNQSIKRSLVKYINDEQNDWDFYLKRVAHSINTSYQSSTKYTPEEVLLKMKPVSVTLLNKLTDIHNVDETDVVTTLTVDVHMEETLAAVAMIDEKVMANIADSQAKQKKVYAKRKEKGAKSFTFKTGDLVLRQNNRKAGRKGSRLEDDWLGPYEIADFFSKGQVTLCKNGNRLKTKANAAQLKPYRTPATPVPTVVTPAALTLPVSVTMSPATPVSTAVTPAAFTLPVSVTMSPATPASTAVTPAAFTLPVTVADTSEIHVGGYKLSKVDLDTLRPNQWLNDQVINSYLWLLMDVVNKQFPGTVYVLSTFTEMLWKDQDVGRTCFTKVKFSDFHMVLLPLHVNGNHWILLVADVSRKAISVFDSLGKTTAASYLKAWERFMQKRDEVGIEDLTGWTCLEKTSTRQCDGHSCGIFVLMNAEAILYEMNVHCIDASLISKFRHHIYKRLMEAGDVHQQQQNYDVPSKNASVSLLSHQLLPFHEKWPKSTRL